MQRRLPLLIALGAAFGSGCGAGGAGARCRFNSDCDPGLFCDSSTATCQPPSGLDGGGGSDGQAAGTDATPGADAQGGGDAGSGTDGGADADTDAGPPICGDGAPEPPEECDDGNLLAGDGCGPSCNAEVPCIRSPLATPTPAGVLDMGSMDDGQWEIDLAPSSFPFDGATHDRVSIGTNGYFLFGTGSFPDATGWTNAATDTDLRYAAGESILSWLATDATVSRATVTHSLDLTAGRLVVDFENYGALNASTSDVDAQIILHLSSGSFEILFLAGNFIPEGTRDWNIGVSEPALSAATLCSVWDFEAAALGSTMSFPAGCLTNHLTGALPAGAGTASHYTPLAGNAFCFVKTAGGWDVSYAPIIFGP